MSALTLPLIALLQQQGALDPSHQSWSQFLGLETALSNAQVRISEGAGLTWYGRGTPGSDVLAFQTDASQPTPVFTAALTNPDGFVAAADVPFIVVFERTPPSLVAFSTQGPLPVWTWPLPGVGLANTPDPLAITPDGATIAAAVDGGTHHRVHVLDGTTGIELGSRQSPPVSGLQLADDGSRVAIFANAPVVLQLPEFQAELSLPAWPTVYNRTLEHAAQLDFATDDLRVWSRAPNGAWSLTYEGLGANESPRAFSGDGKTLVIRTTSADLGLRDLVTGGALIATHDPPATFWMADVDETGDRIAVEGQGIRRIEVLDRSGAIVADEDTFGMSDFETLDFDLSSDGRFVGIIGRNSNLFGDRWHAKMLDLDLSPLSYCEAKLSSSFCWTLLSAGPGSNPISGAGDFVVHADFVEPQTTGLFFYGLSGSADLPFLGGTLCLSAPLFRTGVQASGGTAPFACDGRFSLLLNDGVSPFDRPGGKVWLQAWYRDPGTGGGILGAALSDAIEVTFD